MHYYCSMGRGFCVKGILLFHQVGRFVNLSIMDHFAHVVTRERKLNHLFVCYCYFPQTALW